MIAFNDTTVVSNKERQMAEKQDGYRKTAIRMPPDLHNKVHELAKAEDRTFNGQLLAMLKEVAAKAQQQTQGVAQ